MKYLKILTIVLVAIFLPATVYAETTKPRVSIWEGGIFYYRYDWVYCLSYNISYGVQGRITIKILSEV